MTADSATTRSRRAILAAALGAGAATLASAVGRPLEVRAAGPAITVGDTVTGSATTTLDISGAANAAAAFWALSDGGIGVAGSSSSERGVAGASDSGTGVQGTSNGGIGVVGLGSTAGVQGTSNAGIGVVGLGSTAGVQGTSTGGYGVDGRNDIGVGVHGRSTGSTGVQGFSLPVGQALLPFPPGNTGVHGYCDLDAGAAGVYGQSQIGIGVRATSVSGTALDASSAHGVAVGGLSTTGNGVVGGSTSGTGVLATSSTGTALRVSGKATFSRSGRAKVGAGKAFVDVTVPGGVASGALCFANLTVYRSGVTVAAVRPAYPSAGKMRIYLNKSLATATYVAWIVMG